MTLLRRIFHSWRSWVYMPLAFVTGASLNQLFKDNPLYPDSVSIALIIICTLIAIPSIFRE